MQIWLSIYLSTCLSVSVCLSTYLPIYLSVFLSISVCLSVHPSIHPSTHPYLPTYLPTYLSISLSIYLWLYIPLLGLGRFFSFLNLYTVGKYSWMEDQPVTRPLPAHTGQHKHRINAHGHDLSGIRTHKTSVRASEDSSCLRPRDHCDRHKSMIIYIKRTYTRSLQDWNMCNGEDVTWKTKQQFLIGSVTTISLYVSN
jgi:hypothetical protein